MKHSKRLTAIARILTDAGIPVIAMHNAGPSTDECIEITANLSISISTGTILLTHQRGMEFFMIPVTQQNMVAAIQKKLAEVSHETTTP